MKQIYKITPYLALIIIFQNCSPKYTASFQKTDSKYYNTSNQTVENKELEEQIVVETTQPELLASTNEEVVEQIITENVIKSKVERSKQLENANKNLNEREKEILSEVRESLKSMTKEEKKALRSTFKEKLKEMKKSDRRDDAAFVLIVILSIIIPPVGMLLYEGEITNRFWLSLVLTLLGYLPGLIYTLYVVLGGK
ncbi:MAG: YqaE/Pmp3 family membrane protein [bacterium]|nr:YqaE/Pmp3 family membrane protein [bacterium]